MENSNPDKDKPDCPVCKVATIPTEPEKFVCYGIVLRDVVKMEQLAPVVCKYHAKMMLTFYDLMMLFAEAEEKLEKLANTVPVVESDKNDNDKDLN